MKTHVLPLLLLLVTLLLTACSGDGTVTETTQAPQTQAPERFFEITEDTVIVRADEDEDSIALAQALQEILKEYTGHRLTITTDFLMKDEKPAPSEILVGITNRAIAAPFYAELTPMDAGYAVLGEGTLVIAGGCAQATENALILFQIEVLGRGDSSTGAVKPLSTTLSRIEKASYPVTSMTIGTVPVTDLVISYDTSWSKQIAAELSLTIGRLTGILPATEKRSTAPCRLEVVDTDKHGEHLASFRAEGTILTLETDAQKLDILLPRLTARYFPETLTGEVEIELKPEQIVPLFDESAWNGLILDSITNQKDVAEGIISYTRNYQDTEGKPVRVHVVEIAPGAATPVLGTMGSSYTIGGVATVPDQMRAEEQRTGNTVLCAINSSFFFWEDAYVPSGLLMKDGKVVSAAHRDLYEVFAVMKDGSYYFGLPTGVAQGNIDQACSGWLMLMRDGKITDMGLSLNHPDTSHTRHPRSGIGMKADGTLVIAVADGRQPEYSNGASLPDFALIFRDLGCEVAMNLDGGGSSTLCTQAVPGQIEIINSPSGQDPRAVVSSILFVKED